MPIVPYFIIFSSIAITNFPQLVKQKRWKKYLIILLTLFIITNIPLIDKKERLSNAHYNYGITLERRNKLAEAEKEYQSAITLDPLFSSAFLNLGRVYFKQRDLDKAIKTWQKVLEIEPGNKKAINNIEKTLMLR